MKNIYSLFWILIWNYLFISLLIAAPQTDEEVINLAHSLYTAGYHSVEADAIQKQHHCGYPLSEQLAEALSSPEISKITKETIKAIASSAMPEFNQYIYTSNLNIYFTDNNPDSNQNISIEVAQDLADQMQNSFDKLLVQFGKVATDTNGLLTVYVYNLGEGLYGFTNSDDNNIHLNSTVMPIECFRRTTGAHELFHRFQFAYGLDKIENEPDQTWWVESSSDWAMHYCFPNEFDYISSGNDFLINPNLRLFTERSYEANLLWIFLGERYLEQYGFLNDEAFIIQQMLMAYEQGARNKNLISSVTRPFLNQSASNFMQDWHETNGLIGRNGSSEKYLYTDENNTTDNCGVTYNFLPVPVFETIFVDSDEFAWTSQNLEVNKGGAVYHQFTIDPGVTQLDITVRGITPEAEYMVSLIGLKDNVPLLFLRDNKKSSQFTLAWNPGEYDQFLLVVASRQKSGTYFIEII